MNSTEVFALILIAIAVVAGAIYLARRNKSDPRGWSVGPIINGKNYSSPVAIDASGSFTFPTEPPGAHYVTTDCPPLWGKTKLVLHWRMEADPTVEFHPTTDPTGQAIGPTLYFQRKGDPWDADGWRWWATPYAVTEVKPGEFTMEVPLTPEAWTSVNVMTGLKNPDMFALALQNTARMGHTWGGGSDLHAGFGHGVYASAPAKFVLVDLHAE